MKSYPAGESLVGYDRCSLWRQLSEDVGHGRD